MTRRWRALLLVLGGVAAACSAVPREAGAGRGLGELRVGERELDARAFAAEAAFLFPDESRALARSLLRAELARLEGRRLGLEAPAAEVEEALRLALAGLEAGLPLDQDFEAWARARYARSGDELRAAIRRHLEENLLYQLVLRADAALAGRWRLHLLVASDEDQAAAWAARLRQGADPRMLAAESLDRGASGAGERVLPVYLPDPLGAALRGAAPGAVVGPLRLAGDRSWWVARVAEPLPAASGVPPLTVLLAELQERPIDPLEARAWFEEMLHRYTAREGLPAIQAPSPAFVPRARP